MRYLGVRRRTWDKLRRQLRAVKLGTSKLYARKDLDHLFDRLKGFDRVAENPGSDKEAPLFARDTGARAPEAKSPSDGRPSNPTKGEKPWVVKQASTKTRKPAAGGSTDASKIIGSIRALTATRKPSAGS
jgi:hypothetical protein